jgi:hypothetical protein
MIKASFCAIAMLIGALIGVHAPDEWRGDVSRVAQATYTMSATSMALADHQR